MKKCQLHTYLEQIGLKGCKNKTVLHEAKQVYWREYRRKWAARKREESPTFTISFSKKELNTISAAAKHFQLSNTQTIKQGALAYISNTELSNKRLFGAVKQLLTKCCCTISSILEAAQNSAEAKDQVMHHLIDIENQILTVIKNNDNKITE
jgi:hypothetical protein